MVLSGAGVFFVGAGAAPPKLISMIEVFAATSAGVPAWGRIWAPMMHLIRVQSKEPNFSLTVSVTVGILPLASALTKVAPPARLQSLGPFIPALHWPTAICFMFGLKPLPLTVTRSPSLRPVVLLTVRLAAAYAGAAPKSDAGPSSTTTAAASAASRRRGVAFTFTSWLWNENRVRALHGGVVRTEVGTHHVGVGADLVGFAVSDDSAARPSRSAGPRCATAGAGRAR